MQDPANVRRVLEAARNRLVHCSCATNPERDGCYRCLFLYRHSSDMPETSRSAAVAIITRILDHWDPLKRVKSLGDVSISGLMDSLLEARFIEALRRAGSATMKSTVTKAIVLGKPGYRWDIGDRAWNIEPQRGHAASEGFGIGVSIDFVLQPTRADDRPVAIFLDGWAYHRNQIGRDMLQRMSLLTSGKYDVWSFTWEDIAGALGGPEAANLPQPEPLLYRDADRLAKVLASPTVAVPHTLRTRLAEPSWRWFVDTLSGTYPAADAHRLAWATVFSQLAPLTDVAGWSDGIGVLPPAARAWVAPSGQKHLVSCWPAAEGHHATIFSYGDGALLKSDIEGIGTTPSVALRLVACLHDDVDPTLETSLRRSWAGLLRLANFVRPLRHIWLVARHSMETLDYSTLALMRDSSAGHEDEGPWAEVLSEVVSEARDLAGRLARADLPEPDVGVDLPDVMGDALDAVAEMAWPAHRVAIVARPLEAAERARLEAGWQVFTVAELSEDEGPVVNAVRTRCTQEDSQ
jgi:DEAD/DEAH box helicase domain-containing protein